MIVLMRHAMIESKGRCIGRTAVPLSSAGVKQANELPDLLCSVGFTRLCSSPSQRAQDTMAPLAASLSIDVDIVSELDEINMGTWDGLDFEILRQKYPNEYAERGERLGHFRSPDGESFLDVADRALLVLNELSKGRQPVLGMTHAGVIRSVLCRITGHPMDDLFHFNPGYTCCTLLAPSERGFELVATEVAPDKVHSFL